MGRGAGGVLCGPGSCVSAGIASGVPGWERANIAVAPPVQGPCLSASAAYRAHLGGVFVVFSGFFAGPHRRGPLRSRTILGSVISSTHCLAHSLLSEERLNR